MLPPVLVTVVAFVLLLAPLTAAAQPPAGGPAAATEKIWIPVTEKGLSGRNGNDGHMLRPRHPDVRGGAVDEFLGRIDLGVRP